MANFGRFGGMGNMQQMMRQAKQMQEKMQKAQEEIENSEVEAASGGGAVIVKLNGKKRLLSIQIKPEAVDPDDVEMLEDLIMAAFNEAFDKADELYAQKMGMLGGLI
ncbi:MAG: YbaB/EbfC family nucleoid-associated protein [Clostridiales bacterium]|nr:YbaB/EbfC family nucleoid-associated protein [Clostridiales bacterium]